MLMPWLLLLLLLLLRFGLLLLLLAPGGQVQGRQHLPAEVEDGVGCGLVVAPGVKLLMCPGRVGSGGGRGVVGRVMHLRGRNSAT